MSGHYVWMLVLLSRVWTVTRNQNRQPMLGACVYVHALQHLSATRSTCLRLTVCVRLQQLLHQASADATVLHSFVDVYVPAVDAFRLLCDRSKEAARTF
jgi:hypothetical protein